jgi:hypothetical protein
MAEWNRVEVTSLCENKPPEGSLYLPQGSPLISQMLVRTSDGKTMLLKGGVREDPGQGACATGRTLASLGGRDKEIQYRTATFAHVLSYDTSILLQLLITIFTFVSTAIVTYSTYLKNISDPTNTFVYATAATLLLVSFALAVFKLIADYRKL